MKKKLEFWLTYGGNIAVTEQNPCGCHPNDYILQWLDFNRVGNLSQRSLSYSFKDRRDFLKWAKNKFLEKLK